MCNITDRIVELENMLAGEQRANARAAKREQKLNQMLVKERLEYALALTDLQDEKGLLRERWAQTVLERQELKKMLRLALEHAHEQIDDEYAAQLTAQLRAEVRGEKANG